VFLMKEIGVYAEKRGDSLVIGNEFLEIHLSSLTGGLLGIKNKRRNVQYVKEQDACPIFYLWTLLSDKIHPHGPTYGNDSEPVKVRCPSGKTFRSYEFKRVERGKTLTIRHTLLGSLDVAYTIKVESGSRLVFWNISVKNRHKDLRWGQVVGIGFPQLAGLCVGKNHEDDILVRPNRFGEKIVDPVSKNGTYPINLCYEGWASMMWMDFYDSEAGLYLASYDKELLMTELESEADVDTKTMRLGLRKYAYIPPGESWSSEPYVVGVHEGDWHWAADRYREWARSWMQKPDVPDWVRESDGWYGVGLGPRHYRNSDVCYRFEDIPSLYEDAEYVGLNWIEVWGQMVMNGCYRFYYPDPYLGTVDEFRKAVEEVRSRGGHIGFYVNIQAFDPRLPHLPEKYKGKIPPDIPIPNWWEEFKNYAALHFDGSYVRQYINHDVWSDGHRIMCTACEGWQNYLLYWVVEKYVKEYGADVMYIDQVSSPPVEYCFNFTHGHRHHGACVTGRVNILRRIMEEGRKITPHFAVAFEGNGDAVGQYGTVHLYTSFAGQTKYPCPEVFSYTFPEYIIIDGFANGWSQETMASYYPRMEGKVWRKEDVVNRVFLLGYRFDLSVPLKRGEAFTEYVRKVINLRRRIKKNLYNSRFMDDLGLGGLPENVEAKVFDHEESLIITILDNRASKKPFKLKVDLEVYRNPRIAGATIHTLEGAKELKCVVCKKMLTIDLGIPHGEIAAVVVRKANK